MSPPAKHPQKPETRLVHAGRHPEEHFGFVNPPVYHASTVLYPTGEDLAAHRSRYQYGRRGTPTTEALEQALAAIEGENCAGVALLPAERDQHERHWENHTPEDAGGANTHRADNPPR